MASDFRSTQAEEGNGSPPPPDSNESAATAAADTPLGHTSPEPGLAPIEQPSADAPAADERPTKPGPAIAQLLQSRLTWEENRASFAAWLDQAPEEALEPELEIVDPHHHLWDMRELNGYNLFGIFRQQYYMAEELLDDCVGGGHNITHTVYAECHSFHSADADPLMAPLGEVQMVQGIAAQFASGKYGKFRGAAGIIGTAGLAKFGAAVEPLLIACKAASPNFRGIRCSAQHDPNISSNFGVGAHGLYRQEKFREGFALLEKHGLVFDAFLYSSQLSDLHDLATAFPGTTIVLDHLGMPVAALGDEYAPAAAYTSRQGEILASWKQDMARIATECPNVNVKIGALSMPHLGHGFGERDVPPSSEEMAAAFEEVCLWTIGAFGPGRCMFESNFPVDKVSTSYTKLWNAYKRITLDAGFSAAERALLFSGTAKRVYGL